MKTQFLNFGLLFVNNEYSLIDDAMVFTDDDAVIVNFVSESERNEYLIANEIVIPLEPNPDFPDPIE